MTTNTRRWLSGLISAFCSGMSGVLALNFIDPSDFNIENPTKLAAGALAFGIVGVINYLAKSPLPPAESDDRVMPPRAWLLPIILTGALAAGACAGQTPAPVAAQPTTEQVQATRAQAIKIAQAVESVGNLVIEARRATTAAYNAQLITRDQAIAAYRAIEDLAPPMSAMIGIASTVTTDPQLRSTVSAMMAVVDTMLQRLVKGSPAMAAAAVSIQAALRVATVYLGGAQ